MAKEKHFQTAEEYEVKMKSPEELKEREELEKKAKSEGKEMRGKTKYEEQLEREDAEKFRIGGLTGHDKGYQQRAKERGYKEHR